MCMGSFMGCNNVSIGRYTYDISFALQDMSTSANIKITA